MRYIPHRLFVGGWGGGLGGKPRVRRRTLNPKREYFGWLGWERNFAEQAMGRLGLLGASPRAQRIHRASETPETLNPKP